MRFSSVAVRALLTLSVAVPALLTPNTVRGQQDQKSQSACYVPGSGTVYRIKETNTPTQCSTGHVEFQISTNAKPGSGPSGAAGGDLGGTYPNPIVVKLQGQPLSPAVPSAGQLLTFSNGAWTPQAAGAATLPVNAAGSFDFSNPNGLVSIGTPATGAIPATGAGTRLMWYPSKSALRAGAVTGTQWDAANIGGGSFASGNDTQASGFNAVALGTSTTASGGEAMAFGYNSVASALASTAFGLGSVASGAGSIGGGDHVTASGTGAIALGINSIASGVNSVALGSAVASAQSAVAIGASVTASGIRSVAMGSVASTAGMTGAFVFGDASSGSPISALSDNHFVVRAQRIWLGTNNAPVATIGRFIETSTGAYLTTGGAWTNSSDVNLKQAFQSVDGEHLLEKIAAMPVATWSYRAEDSAVRHMGPTAQDFRKAFGLGDTDKAIATVDADGVSLAAIKALLQRTTDLRRENDELKSALADLNRRLTELEAVRR